MNKKILNRINDKAIRAFYIFIIGFFSIPLIFNFFNIDIDIELLWFIDASLFIILVAYAKPRWVGLMLIILGLLTHFFLVLIFIWASGELGYGSTIDTLYALYLISTFLVALLGFFLSKIKDEKKIFKITTIFFVIIILFAKLFVYTNTCNMIIIDDMRRECEERWNYIRSVEELRLPSVVNDLSLDGLTSAKGLHLPEIKGGLSLDGLTSIEYLNLPESINGNLSLNGLTSAKGLHLPEIKGGLFLDGLTSAEYLDLPESINGSLSLDGLASAEGLKLPDSISENLYLLGLTSIEGLKLPEYIGGVLYLNSDLSREEMKKIERNNRWIEICYW